MMRNPTPLVAASISAATMLPQAPPMAIRMPVMIPGETVTPGRAEESPTGRGATGRGQGCATPPAAQGAGEASDQEVEPADRGRARRGVDQGRDHFFTMEYRIEGRLGGPPRD